MTEGSVVSIGDVYVDYISDLMSLTFSEVNNSFSGTNIFSPVQIKVGGNGVQFSIAAKEAGFKTSTLIGAIGGYLTDEGLVTPDLSGQFVLEYLQKHDIQPLIMVDPNSETGRVLLVYFPPANRLMISDRRANSSFSKLSITPEIEENCRRADLLFVSGYTLLEQERRDAVLSLLSSNRSQGHAKIALDIVPHNIYQNLSFEQLQTFTDGIVDWIFIEINTASRLLGYGLLEQIPSPKFVEQILMELTDLFPSLILSINLQHEIVIDNGKRWEQKFLDRIQGINMRGHQTLFQAKVLYDSIT